MATVDARPALARLRDRPGLALAVAVALLLVADVALRSLDGRLPLHQLAVYLWDGVVVGLIVGLAGIGLSMTYSILGFANFAHGDYVTTGAFVGWGATYAVAGYGTAEIGRLLLVGPAQQVFGSDLGISALGTPLAVVAGLLVAALGTALVVLAIDRLVYRPMRDEGSIALLIASVGVSFVVRYLIAFVYGSGSRGTTVIPPTWRVDVVDGAVTVSLHEVVLVAVALALMVAVHAVMTRTTLGTAMRAMADNEDLALVTGIPTERVVRWTWLMGGGLAGAAGFLVVLERGNIGFQMGWLLVLLIFAAVILGGIGSIYGAIAGGLIVGIAQNLSLIWLPSGDFTRQTAFVLMILILVYRPEGIFGGTSTA